MELLTVMAVGARGSPSAATATLTHVSPSQLCAEARIPRGIDNADHHWSNWESNRSKPGIRVPQTGQGTLRMQLEPPESDGDRIDID